MAVTATDIPSQTVAGLGIVPAPNRYGVGESVYRDLEELLRNPESNFAATVAGAAKGLNLGVVFSGNSKDRVRDVVQAGTKVGVEAEEGRDEVREIEAQRQRVAESLKTKDKALEAHQEDLKAPKPSILAEVLEGGKSPFERLGQTSPDAAQMAEKDTGKPVVREEIRGVDDTRHITTSLGMISFDPNASHDILPPTATPAVARAAEPSAALPSRTA